MGLTAPTPCTPRPEECRNEKHDHFGQIEHAENFGEPIPDSDRLVCTDCALPMHYDYGDDLYHHDNPEAPGCFLIAPEGAR